MVELRALDSDYAGGTPPDGPGPEKKKVSLNALDSPYVGGAPAAGFIKDLELVAMLSSFDDPYDSPRGKRDFVLSLEKSETDPESGKEVSLYGIKSRYKNASVNSWSAPLFRIGIEKDTGRVFYPGSPDADLTVETIKARVMAIALLGGGVGQGEEGPE